MDSKTSSSNIYYKEGRYSLFKKKCPETGFKRSEISVASLPHDVKSFFPHKTLNHIQSVTYSVIYETSENILLLAPTGAGKTNIAFLSMLKEYLEMTNINPTRIRKTEVLRMIYVCPMKALASEMVATFTELLSKLNLKVTECTGDTQVSPALLRQSNLLICTPEKLDMLSRRDLNFFSNYSLIIFDEIHLLGSQRGAVIESLATKIFRNLPASKDEFGQRGRQNGNKIRVVGLSATIPNPEDVSEFLRVDRGLFYFGEEFRPVPLNMKIVGVLNYPTDKKKKQVGAKPMKEKQMATKIQNDYLLNLLFELFMKKYKRQKTILIFVHSRKETLKIAKYLSQRVNGHETPKSSHNTHRLRKDFTDFPADLADLLQTGFCVHHAGLKRPLRNKIESMFAQRQFSVLVSTSTLSWGVNLPASCVFIFGTKYYSAEKGGLIDISIEDVLQMFGRAGRPQFDKKGSACLITSSSTLHQKFVSDLTRPHALESFLTTKLLDFLNSEVAARESISKKDLFDYLENSFFNIRLKRNPSHYGATWDFSGTFITYKNQLIEYNINKLLANRLIKEKNGKASGMSSNVATITTNTLESLSVSSETAEKLLTIRKKRQNKRRNNKRQEKNALTNQNSDKNTNTNFLVTTETKSIFNDIIGTNNSILLMEEVNSDKRTFHPTPLGKTLSYFYVNVDNAVHLSLLYSLRFDVSFGVHLLSMLNEFGGLLMREEEVKKVKRFYALLPFKSYRGIASSNGSLFGEQAEDKDFYGDENEDLDEGLEGERAKVEVLINIFILRNDSLYKDRHENLRSLRLDKISTYFISDYLYIEQNLPRLCQAVLNCALISESKYSILAFARLTKMVRMGKVLRENTIEILVEYLNAHHGGKCLFKKKASVAEHLNTISRKAYFCNREGDLTTIEGLRNLTESEYIKIFGEILAEEGMRILKNLIYLYPVWKLDKYYKDGKENLVFLISNQAQIFGNGIEMQTRGQDSKTTFGSTFLFFQNDKLRMFKEVSEFSGKNKSFSFSIPCGGETMGEYEIWVSNKQFPEDLIKIY